VIQSTPGDHVAVTRSSTATTIDPAKLAAFGGRYALTPGFILTVTSRDGRLLVQATNQAEYEVFPKAKTHFLSVDERAAYLRTGTR
jgi:hypothetical protein